MKKQNYLHVGIGDVVRIKADLVIHTRIVEGIVVEMSDSCSSGINVNIDAIIENCKK